MLANIKVSRRFSTFLTDWDYEQYLCVGGYGSGKSYHIVLKIILKLMQEKRTALVLRQVRETIKESCYSLFKEILSENDMLSINNGKDGKIVVTLSPMEIRFPNGSRVIFKGLDNEEKIKSINDVSIVWIEECSEIRYSAFKELLGRVRNPNVSLHFILSCNPVGKENWVYTTFFVRLDNNGKERVIQSPEELYRRRTIINKKINKKNGGVYYHHSLPDDNPFLPRSYIARLDELKETDRALWVVARWGRFGVSGTRVLPNFVIAKDARAFVNKVNSISAHYHYFGLDFGFEESYNALISCCVDDKEKVLYIYDEVYMNKVTDDYFAQREDVRKVAHRAETCDKAIGADSAEPKTIKFYRLQGFPMYGAKKYAGSRLENTKKMKRFKKIVCSPKCKNTIRELKELTYAKDSRGNVIYDEFNIDAHTFSALWYALDKYTVADIKTDLYKTYSRAS